MNHFHHPDGERFQTASLNQTEKAEVFAEVMKRLKNSSEPERGQLQAQTDAAILGHEAYALGYDNLRRGNPVAAKRWLRVAADHNVPGAEQALDEIEAGPTPHAPPEPLTIGIAMDTEPCLTGMAPADHHDFEKWNASFSDWIQVGLTMDAARTEAKQITAQARAAADQLIAETRKDIQRAQAKAQQEITGQHRTAAELLRKAEELQRQASLLLQKAHREDEEAAGNWRLLEYLRDYDVVQTPQAHCGAQDIERQRSLTSMQVRTAIRALPATAHAETDTPLTVIVDGLDEIRSSIWQAWSHNLFKFCHQVLNETTERFTDTMAEHFLTLDPNSHVALTNRIQRAPSRLKADWSTDSNRRFWFSDGVMRFTLACWSTHDETPSVCSLPENPTQWIIARNEVVPATPDPGHPRDAVHLKIYWMAEDYTEAIESSTATDVVDAHKAPITPR
ncbi:hypothetical protein ACIRQQ_38665 [Streptomyces fuscichromogenes]|uniref:hypothetical protein n=1 Tax=Streptomyces fuscichromogenes TaxID=1324013 RepID=UPI00380AF3F4